MSLPIFCVNLERSVERRKKMQKQFKKIKAPAQFIKAFDGNDITQNLLDRVGYKNQITKNELGCALSHLYLYEKIIAENIDMAIICEDDCKFNISYENIKKRLSLMPKDASICYLYTLVPYSKVNKYFGLLDIRYDFFGTTCYIITKKCCENVLQYVKQNNIIMQSDTALEALIIKKIIKPYVLIYNLAEHYGYCYSTLGHDYHTRKSMFRYKLTSQIRKIIGNLNIPYDYITKPNLSYKDYSRYKTNKNLYENGYSLYNEYKNLVEG